MITHEQISRQRDRILALAQLHAASDVRIFGSVARGDADEKSDLDLVVRFEPGRSFLDQGGLLMDLRDLLKIEVHVVDEEALSGRFEQIVRQEAISL